MNISFIGLGQMGSAMAANALKAGHAVSVWNRSPEPAKALAGAGATVVHSPDAAFCGDAVFSMLADDAAVRAVFIDSGLLERAPKGTIHVNMATISVALCEELAGLHAHHGLAYVAAPVLGRPDVAAAAKLNIVAAGQDEAIDRIQPVFDVIGQKTWRVGADPRHANVFKLTANFMLAAAIETTGEAAALLSGYDIDPHAFLNVITNTLFPGPVYQGYGKMIADRRYEPAMFKARLGLKDVRLALAAGDAVNTPLPVASLVRDSLFDALAHDEGDMDFAVLGKVAARRAQRQTAVENDRFPRVGKALLPDNQRAVYEGIESRRGKIPAPYFALLSSPDVADLFERYSTLLWDGVLPRDILEAVFLATAVRYRCRFQWMNHVDRALEAGLSADAMETIGRGSVPDQPGDLACVMKFVDMLAREHRISDALFDAVTKRFGKQGLAELVAFCGVSVSIAMLLNMRQPDLPKGKAAPF